MQDQFLKQAQQRHADLPLRFDDVLVIVGGGGVDGELLTRLHANGAPIVGADGGADVCLELGIMPTAIIGDMDSLNAQADWPDRSRLIKIEEQQTTDFEKCLYVTEAPVTVALGMMGGRLDHTLAGLDAAGRYAAMRHIMFVDVEDVALVATGRVSFEIGAGERVSVHPLRQVSFARSEGLAFPLDGLTLAPGVATGTSNKAIDGPVTIEPAAGDRSPWLLILDRIHLDMLMRQCLDRRN